MSKTSIWCDLIWKISSVELVKTIPLQEIEEMFIFIRPWQNNYAVYSVGHESCILGEEILYFKGEEIKYYLNKDR